MNLAPWFGRFFETVPGQSESVQSVTRIDFSFAAEWANDPAVLLLFAAGVVAIAAAWYLRGQPQCKPRWRVPLAVIRSAVLVLVLLTIAQPILRVQYTQQPRPWLWLLFDGTDSMGLADELPAAERSDLNRILGREEIGVSPGTASNEPAGTEPQVPTAKASSSSSQAADFSQPTRLSDMQAMLSRDRQNLIAELEKKFRLKGFVFEEPGQIRELKNSRVPAAEGASADQAAEANQPAASSATPTSAANLAELTGVELGRNWARQLTHAGSVTALGESLQQLTQRPGSGHLGGVVVFSDFNNNSGVAPESVAKQLAAPVFTVGVGPVSALDLQVNIQAPLLLKRGERSLFSVSVRHSGMEDRTVPVRVTIQPATDFSDPSAADSGDASRGLRSGSAAVGSSATAELIVERNVQLTAREVTFEVPYTPQQAGRFVVAVTTPVVTGEIVSQNNTAARLITVQDDFLRLLFVEYEPTWEWRFIKEVFHRDKLVGRRGFRTYLSSADPTVRQTNDLFVSTLTPRRADFFANDVLFLGDIPGQLLTPRFCDMIREFVETFGGGLVIISGPRYGPGQLAATRLADLLPVVVDPASRVRDCPPFQLELTAASTEFDFMQLGNSAAETAAAWSTLGQLSWYQPVQRLHPLATAIAVHPSDSTAESGARQPLIAIRKFGRGEVVYLANNETWRLRRGKGEVHYRQFWGQMIHRLGLSHALGSAKRFLVRTDQQQYRVDDPVLVSVEAFDANFEPLAMTSSTPPLDGVWARPASAETPASQQSLKIQPLRQGLFEIRLTALTPGEHTLSVTDPVTGEPVQTAFNVMSSSPERRLAIRNARLQQQLADVTGGTSWTLDTVDELPETLAPVTRVETSQRAIPLWSTWPWFLAIAMLLLGEWVIRKGIHLP